MEQPTIFECHPLIFYGDWDDCQGSQFAVAWGEAGYFVSVYTFSGLDYGGGLARASDKIPLKEMEEIVEKYKSKTIDKYEAITLVNKLLAKYGEKLS